MEQKTLMDALVQVKRTGNLLNEVHDLTRQLAEAMDRNDQVAAQMLISMRAEPIQKLKAADRALREQLADLPNREEAAQLAALLNGGPPGEGLEQTMCDLLAANRRRLQQITDLDRILNRKIAREKSFYQ